MKRHLQCAEHYYYYYCYYYYYYDYYYDYYYYYYYDYYDYYYYYYERSDLPHPRFEIRDSRSEIRDPNPRFEIRDLRFELRDSRSRFEIRDSRSEIRDSTSDIRGPRFEIRDSRSEIRDYTTVRVTIVTFDLRSLQLPLSHFGIPFLGLFQTDFGDKPQWIYCKSWMFNFPTWLKIPFVLPKKGGCQSTNPLQKTKSLSLISTILFGTIFWGNRLILSSFFEAKLPFPNYTP